MRNLVRTVVMLAGVLLLPAAAFAQAGLAGTVKDASGAILPGVTVEAASPALIEKTRSVVTDGSGQYKIENLRPGTYSVTFTLPGFSTVKRDGVELSGSFVATINGEMKVGAVEETITVSGETPLVDIQSTSRQAVLTKDVIDALPTGRSYSALAVLLPGVNNNARNVGGQEGGNMDTLTIHGGAAGDQRILQNGLNVMTLQTGGGNIGGMIPNQSAAQEVAVDTGGASAERQTGGVAINYIQRDGGNTFKSYTFFTYGGEGLASSNLTPRLQTGPYGATGVPNAPGVTFVNSLKETWEINPGLGGPIMKDKLWFYYAVRYQRAQDYSAGMYLNKNTFDLTKYTYVADTNQPVALSTDGRFNDSQLRLTWQATPRNKFAGTWDQQTKCECPRFISTTRAPETAMEYRFPVQQLIHGEWFSTVTSRLLVEFVGLHRTERWGNMHLRPENSDLLASNTAAAALFNQKIGITEQNAVNGQQANLNYNGPSGIFNNNWVPSYHYRGAVSYVTGAHSFKVGFNEAVGYIDNLNYLTTITATGAPNPVRYRFKSPVDANSNITAAGGLPTANQVTAYATSYDIRNDQNHDFGLFAQDKWTMNKLTLNYGLRFDWFKSSYPDQVLPASDLFKNTTLPRAVSNNLAGFENLNWKDITPRFGLAYDLKGDGKTAIKVSINKYVAGQTGNGNATTNPVTRLTNSASRTWTDSDKDFVVDCNLASPLAQSAAINGPGTDTCAALTGAGAQFGTLVATAIPSDNFRTGWNKRGYNWEFSAGVQREILPRVSLDVSYFRRLFGNFTVTDNLSVNPTNFTKFNVIAPVDSRLGEASGSTITGFYDQLPTTTAGTACGGTTGVPVVLPCNIQSNNATILVNGTNLNGANQIQHWNGVDFNVNARLGAGITLRGGVSTGRTSNNNCDVVALVPESLGNTPQGYCATDTPFLTQVKVIGSYTIPRFDVQISGTFQSIPGPALQGVFTLDNATGNIATNSTLGRNTTAAGGQKTVNLLNEGMPIYGERLNQIDLRFGKIIKYGRTRTNVSIDLYNLLNEDTVLTTNSAFETLYRPQTVVQARFVKFSAQFDF